MSYYHYTSRQAAQNIACTSLLMPGRGGRIYLSPDLYGIGYEAANALAIPPSRNVEMGIEIPDTVVSTASPRGPRLIGPLRGQGGVILRRGGGREVTVSGPIPVGSNWLSLREP